MNIIWLQSYLIFVSFCTPPYFLACKKYTKKVRKFTTKIASRQNSINFWLAYLVFWLAYLVFWLAYLVFWLSYSIFCWCTWFFLGLTSVLFIVVRDLVCLLGILVGVLGFFGWCIWYFVCYILWINFHKQYLLCSLWKKVHRLEKSTPPPVVAVVTNISYGYISIYFHLIWSIF